MKPTKKRFFSIWYRLKLNYKNKKKQRKIYNTVRTITYQKAIECDIT